MTGYGAAVVCDPCTITTSPTLIQLLALCAIFAGVRANEAPAGMPNYSDDIRVMLAMSKFPYPFPFFPYSPRSQICFHCMTTGRCPPQNTGGREKSHRPRTCGPVRSRFTRYYKYQCKTSADSRHKTDQSTLLLGTETKCACSLARAFDRFSKPAETSTSGRTMWPKKRRIPRIWAAGSVIVMISAKRLEQLPRAEPLGSRWYDQS
jgi:hypothetical protein